MIVEALAQVGAIVLMYGRAEKLTPLPGRSIDTLRFRRSGCAWETSCSLEVELTVARETVGKMKARATVDGQTRRSG